MGDAEQRSKLEMLMTIMKAIQYDETRAERFKRPFNPANGSLVTYFDNGDCFQFDSLNDAAVVKHLYDKVTTDERKILCIADIGSRRL